MAGLLLIVEIATTEAIFGIAKYANPSKPKAEVAKIIIKRFFFISRA